MAIRPDIDAHVRLLPPKATAKGMFHADVIAHVVKRVPEEELFTRAGLPRRRYIGFIDYPYEDFLKLVAHGGPLAFPDLTPAEAVRRLGQAAYPKVLDTHVGRMLFGVLNNDITQVLKHGPKAYGLFASFGDVRADVVGERHVLYTFKNFPAFLESYQVGVVEGALLFCGAKPDVKVDLADLASAQFDIRW